MIDSDELKAKLAAEIEKAINKCLDDAGVDKLIPIVLEDNDRITEIRLSHIAEDGCAIVDVTEEFKHPMKKAYVTFELKENDNGNL